MLRQNARKMQKKLSVKKMLNETRTQKQKRTLGTLN
jgi:hypothetical protein